MGIRAKALTCRTALCRPSSQRHSGQSGMVRRGREGWAQMRLGQRRISVLVGHTPWPQRSNPLPRQGLLPKGQVLLWFRKVTSVQGIRKCSRLVAKAGCHCAFFFGFPSRKNRRCFQYAARRFSPAMSLRSKNGWGSATAPTGGGWSTAFCAVAEDAGLARQSQSPERPTRQFAV